MKTLIVYSTIYGFAGKCAQTIKSQLNHQADIVNIMTDSPIDPSGYENVVLGGSIYAGSIQKKLLAYINTYKNTLLSKNLYLFISSAESETDYCSKVFPHEITDAAKVKIHAGGELVVSRMKFGHKILMKLIGKSKDFSMTEEENIRKISSAINSSAG